MPQTQQQQAASNSRAASILLCMACMMALSGCTFVPTPTRLVNKMQLGEKGAPRNLKVCLIVKDERPAAIQKINMCGVTHTTIFLIPTSFAFLAHLEHLDAIVAHHMKKQLENHGYTVIRSYPAAPEELSSQEVRRSEISSADRAAAWRERNNQDDKEGRNSKAVSDMEAGDEQTISAWGENVDVSDADVVLEVKIRKFWTDYNYWGSYSWMSCNMALCSPKDQIRTVVWGKKARGYGYFFGPFCPLTPGSDIPFSMNTAYWFVLNSFNNACASGDFLNAIETLKKR